MDPRLKIPALALLGLQLTNCKHEDSAIVGDWHAVEIDDKTFPVEYNEAGYNARYGFGLHVEADLAGHLVSYYAQQYDDIGVRGEYQLPLTVDDDDPQFRLTISGPTRSEPGEYDYAAAMLPLRMDIGAALRGTTDDLGAQLKPRASETFLILDCRYADDALDCDKVGPPEADEDGTPTHWRFVRDEEKT